MKRNIFKLSLLIIVTLMSMKVAGNTIDAIVQEAREKEETLAGALIKNEIASVLEKVGEEVQKVTQEKEEISVEKDEVVERIIEVGEYLVENYFLDGYIYYMEEENAKLKERKKEVHEIESYVIQSLIKLKDQIPSILSFQKDAVELLIDEIEELKSKLQQRYADNKQEDEIFDNIYQLALEYFDLYIEIMLEVEDLIVSIQESPNPILALTLVTNKVQQDIMPSMFEIINTSLEFKNHTNLVYMEGVENKVLLTEKEVMEILLDPQTYFGENEN